MERPGKNIWSHLSLEKKILLAVTLMILTLFISNIFIYLQVNKIAGKMDTVYASNVNLSELSEALEHVQKDMGDYVSVKSSDSLESYYKSQQEYQGLLERLNDKTIDKTGKNPGKEHPHDVGILSGYDPGCGAGQAGAERGAVQGGI